MTLDHSTVIARAVKKVGKLSPQAEAVVEALCAELNELLSAKGPARLAIPTLAQMTLYGTKLGLPESESEKCFNHYEANGWRVGKNPMKSWEAAMKNWKRTWQERTYQQPRNANTQPPIRSRCF